MLQPKQAQIWLRHFGAKYIKADGIVGPKTEGAIGQLLKDHNIRPHRDADPLTALSQFIMKKVGGLATGPVDGLLGPKTRQAWKHWLRGSWRGVLMENALGDPTPKKTDPSMNWPKQSEMADFYGAAGTGFETFHMPYPLRFSWDLNAQQTKVRAHKLVIPSLLRIHTELLEYYGFMKLQQLGIDIFGGCVNIRNMRGSSTKLSTHAYGAAWDTNPVSNALHSNRNTALMAKPVYEAFWAAWEKEGWISLGRTRDFDWMHTQAARLG